MSNPRPEHQHRSDNQNRSNDQHRADHKENQPASRQNDDGYVASALDQAKDTLGEAASAVSARGQDAIDGVREVGDNLARAIDISLKNRPYTTLAMAFLMGCSSRSSAERT